MCRNYNFSTALFDSRNDGTETMNFYKVTRSVFKGKQWKRMSCTEYNAERVSATEASDAIRKAIEKCKKKDHETVEKNISKACMICYNTYTKDGKLISESIPV